MSPATLTRHDEQRRARTRERNLARAREEQARRREQRARDAEAERRRELVALGEELGDAQAAYTDALSDAVRKRRGESPAYVRARFDQADRAQQRVLALVSRRRRLQREVAP